MSFVQREAGSGSGTAVPSYVRIQDGTASTLADVVARGDGVNALAVDTELTFYTDNATINNNKVGVYLATLTTKTDTKPEFVQLAQYGTQLVNDVDTSESTMAWTWNADGTVNTEATTIQGKTFTRTYSWNADGTPSGSTVAVT